MLIRSYINASTGNDPYPTGKRQTSWSNEIFIWSVSRRTCSETL